MCMPMMSKSQLDESSECYNKLWYNEQDQWTDNFLWKKKKKQVKDIDFPWF